MINIFRNRKVLALWIIFIAILGFTFFPLYDFPKKGETIDTIPEKIGLIILDKLQNDSAWVEEEYNTSLPRLEEDYAICFASGNTVWGMLEFFFLEKGYIFVTQKDGVVIHVSKAHR